MVARRLHETMRFILSILAIALASSCARRYITVIPPFPDMPLMSFWACESSQFDPSMATCRYVVEDGKTVEFRRAEMRIGHGSRCTTTLISTPPYPPY